MHRHRLKLLGATIAVGLALTLGMTAGAEPSLDATMRGIVERFRATLDDESLRTLNAEAVLGFLSDEERAVLATKYWQFDVNVPVVVSVIRHVEQPVTPFWLEERGFRKTELLVRNEEWLYEVWQKEFDAGHVGLGINGFDNHRTPYVVCIGPREAGATVEITNLNPRDEAVIEMKKGAWHYRDWADAYVMEAPASLEGQHLLTTNRGRARAAHLVGAFRETPYPSSSKPDHVVLTWSENPRTTQTIQWRTNPEVKSGLVRYRAKEATSNVNSEARATVQLIGNPLLMNDPYAHQHTAVLRGLEPATAYEYSVGSLDNDTWSKPAHFNTAPAADAPFSFVYFGDTHRSPNWGRLLQAAAERHPETAFYTVAGDVVSTGLYRDDWDAFFEYAHGVFNRKPVAFGLGNHDNQDTLGAWLPLALSRFPHNGPEGIEPGSTYSFRYGNALFLVLSVAESIEAQTKWLEEQLARTDATWKIAVFHYPMFYLGRDEEYLAIRRAWQPVFDRYHLDLMLGGHVHYYLRTKPMKGELPAASPADGTIYLISVGIPGRERSRRTPDFVEKFMSGGPWYQTFDIDGNRLAYRVYDMEGKVCDEMLIEK